eukprot:m.203105 g.203105  ORF g.203105 m.203105 type:complete len:807 (-) comp32845_c8_seq2:31-2451(-)
MEQSPISRNAALVVVAVVALVLVSSQVSPSNKAKAPKIARPAVANTMKSANVHTSKNVPPAPQQKSPAAPPTNFPQSTDCIAVPDLGFTSALSAKPPPDEFHENPFLAKYVTPEMRAYWDEVLQRSKQNGDEIKLKFESVPDCNSGNFATVKGCWKANDAWPPRRGFTVDQKWTKVDECKCAEGAEANSSTWNVYRREFCQTLIAEIDRKHPLPTELKPHLDLNYAEGLDGKGDMKNKFMKPFCGGQAVGELSFDPVTVRNSFLQLQSSLAIFYRGEEHLRGFLAHASSPADTMAMQVLADRLAARLVRGGDFVIGGIGDSTQAGADNCFFDGWMNSFERQLHPYLAAANVELVIRNGAHNGGHGTTEQLHCAKSIVGADTDVLMLSAPFVKPSDIGQEDFVRRALISGITPVIMYGARETNIHQYQKFGVLFGKRNDPVEHDMQWVPPSGGRNWFWKRPGDSFCHMEGTRSGSSAVRSRNWHPGPMGHQQMSDSLSYWFSSVAVLALEKISAALTESGGKLAPLKEKWPARNPVKPSDFSEGMAACERSKFYDETVHHITKVKAQRCGNVTDIGEKICEPMELCGGGNPINNGLATCITSLEPAYGPTFKDWLVTDGPQWEASKPNHGEQWKTVHMEPYSAKTMECPTNGACGSRQEVLPGVFERARSPEACTHLDAETYLTADGRSWGTLKIPANIMKEGRISLCMSCNWGKGDPRKTVDARNKDFMPAVVKLKSVDGSFHQEFGVKDLDWWNNGFGKTNGKGTCAIITRHLESKIASKEMYLGFSCPTNPEDKGAIVRYLYLQ